MTTKQRAKRKKCKLYGTRQWYVNGVSCMDVYAFVGYSGKSRGDDNWIYGKILDY